MSNDSVIFTQPTTIREQGQTVSRTVILSKGENGLSVVTGSMPPLNVPINGVTYEMSLADFMKYGKPVAVISEEKLNKILTPKAYERKGKVNNEEKQAALAALGLAD